MRDPTNYHIHLLFGNEGARDLENLKTRETVSDHTLLDGTALCGNSGIFSDAQAVISSQTQIEKVFPIEARALGPPHSNSKLLCTENLKTTKVEN